MKKMSLLFIFTTLPAMDRPIHKIEKEIPTLRTLCLQYILINNVPRGSSSNCLVEQAQIQENVCDFYISRGLTHNSVSILKTILEKNIIVPENYRIIPEIFKQWPSSPIRRWKAACAMEPFTSLLKLIADKNLASKEEFFDALNIVIREQTDSFALAEFLIQVSLQNDLSNYPHGNVAAFPLCKEIPSLERKLFLKTVINARISLELKNSMLRRAVHQKICHNQQEYEPIISCLLENGADKTILSPLEQTHLICAKD